MSEISEETIAEIERELLKDGSIDRLVAHAFQKMRKHYWQGVLGGSAPGGKEARHVVFEAIEKIIEGRRSWDPKEQPDLFVCVRQTIDSDISHLVESWENRRFRSEAALTRAGENGETVEGFHEIRATKPNPSEACERAESEREWEDRLFRFFEFLNDDVPLQKVLELMFDGLKSHAIAERLSISDKEMYNLSRKLKRCADDFKKLEQTKSQKAGAHAER